MPPGLANAFRHHEGFSAIYTNLRRDSGARLVPLACVEWIVPLQSEKLMCLITGSRPAAALPNKHGGPPKSWQEIKRTRMTELIPKQRLQRRRTAAWRALDPPPRPAPHLRPAGERFGRGLGSFHQGAWQKVCWQRAGVRRLCWGQQDGERQPKDKSPLAGRRRKPRSERENKPGGLLSPR